MTVAALYIDPKGPYPRLANAQAAWEGMQSGGPAAFIDCWDIARDARKYDGPHPIVAHPPYKHWGRLAHLANVECNGKPGEPHGCGWSGPESKLIVGTCPQCRGIFMRSDRDCAPRAVEQVRKWGGVLEHPAHSRLWEACGLPAPHSPEFARGNWGEPLRIDSFGGCSVRIDQCEWGHVARKPTWLYLVGVPREALEAPPFPGREPTHYASGGRTESSRKGGAVPAGVKVCSEQQRRRTPPLLAEYLVRLASKAAEARKGAA